MAEELKYTQKDFDRLIENIGNKPVSPEVIQQKSEEQAYRDIQFQHLTAKMMLDKKNLIPLSVITREERDDFANAHAVNAGIFGEPMYIEFETFFFDASRSVSTDTIRVSALHGLFDMAKSQLIQPLQEGSRGIVSRILGR